MADFSQTRASNDPRTDRRHAAAARTREVRLSHFDAAMQRRSAARLRGDRPNATISPAGGSRAVPNTLTLNEDPKHEATFQP